MRQFAIAVLTVCALAWGAPTASADSIVLADFGFNVSGTLYPGTMPPFADSSGFDTSTGLGTITLDYRPGAAGTYDLIAFFDHDITGLTNPFDNEFGSVFGAPPAGVTWEIDEPGYTVGDLIPNVVAGALDNMVLNGAGNGPQDIAMAMGFSFIIPDANHRALITLALTTTAPAGGFYLHQSDLAGDVYFALGGANGVEVTDIPTPNDVVPEPASLLLVGSGLAFGLRRLRRK